MRRQDYLRRQVLWALAIVASAPTLAEDQPNDTTTLAAPSNSKSADDGWKARNEADLVAPLMDPAPDKPSDAVDKSEPKGAKVFVSDGPAEPKSILRIIIPDGSLPSMAPPSLKNFSQEAVTPNQTQAKLEPDSSSPHSLYGPGQGLVAPSKPLAGSADKKNELPDLDKANTLKKIDELLKNLATITPAPTAVSNPEQNEPIVELGVGGPAKSNPKDLESLSMIPDEVCGTEESAGDNVELRELEEVQTEAATPMPGRLQVRGLKNLSEGAVDPPSLSRSTPAEPISRREAPRETQSDASRNNDKQSIGDEPAEIPETSGKVGDRVGPNKELILSIGMDSQNRVNANTSRLRTPIERTLRHYWATPEDAKERTHWGMFHNLMIYDKDTLITDGKRRYNAVAWMAGNNPCRNQILFETDGRGIVVKSGVGLQGHQAQLLAVFGLIDVPASYPIYVGKARYSVEDVIRREMLDCKSGNELTFTLIGLSHYIDTNTRWVAEDGQDWNFERLIKEELAQPIVGAACGGTHRLMGFAHALRRRRAEGRPVTGQWERADRYVKDFIAYTWQLQNRDGSMSTSWFEKSEDNGEIDRKIQTTGHMVEFLLTALPDEQLQSPQMLRSMSFLVNTLYEERGHDWPVGPKGHALRALSMYYRRVFERADPWRPVTVARRSVNTSR